MRNFVVVPEGLQADEHGRGTAVPSEAFRLVLERVAAEARAGERIWLSPANNFGGPLSEQEAAARFLSGRTEAEVCWFAAESPTYITTRGNAALLRDHLRDRGLWPLADSVLAVYGIHAPRSALIFGQEGFSFASTLAVEGFLDQSKPIVSRLWYIRYPVLHRLYELIAAPAFSLRLR